MSTQAHLPRKFSFSSNFGHFILKMLKNANCKYVHVKKKVTDPANNYEWGPRGQNSGEPTETTWASPTFKFVSAWRMTQKRQSKTYFSHQGPPVGMPAFSPRSDALCGLCPRCAMLLQATASVVPRGLSRLHCVGCPYCARLPPTCAGQGGLCPRCTLLF